MGISLRETEKKPPNFCVPTSKSKNPVLSGILSVSSSLPNFPLALCPNTHFQKQRSRSQWSITSPSKSKTFACGLPKCLNSFPNNNLPMVTPIIFWPSLQSHHAQAFQFKTEYQLYQTPLSIITPSFLYFPSLMDPSPWPIKVFKSLTSSIFFLGTLSP